MLRLRDRAPDPLWLVASLSGSHEWLARTELGDGAAPAVPALGEAA